MTSENVFWNLYVRFFVSQFVVNRQVIVIVIVIPFV